MKKVKDDMSYSEQKHWIGKKVDHNYPMKLLCVVGFLCHKLYMKTKIISNTKEFNIKKTKDI